MNIVGIKRFQDLKNKERRLYLCLAGAVLVDTLEALIKVPAGFFTAQPSFFEGLYSQTSDTNLRLKIVKDELTKISSALEANDLQNSGRSR